MTGRPMGRKAPDEPPRPVLLVCSACGERGCFLGRSVCKDASTATWLEVDEDVYVAGHLRDQAKRKRQP